MTLPFGTPEDMVKGMEELSKVSQMISVLMEVLPPIEVRDNVTFKDRPNKTFIAILIEKKPKLQQKFEKALRESQPETAAQ